MNVFQDLDKLTQMKAAMALEKASESEGGAGMGMGTGLGLMMPAMFAQYFTKKGDSSATPVKGGEPPTCPECHQDISVDAKFCPHCGHQLLVFQQCENCGKNLAPHAKFCSRCGHRVEAKPKEKICPKCGNKNLDDAVYCNQCGEKY